MRENGVANALQFNLGVQDNYNQFQPPAKVLYAPTLNPRWKYLHRLHLFTFPLLDNLYQYQ